MNKVNTLEATLHSTDQKMAYEATNKKDDVIKIDYFKPYGNGDGYTSLELFLISLGSCILATTAALIRKEQYTVKTVGCRVKGIRRTQHPLSFQTIEIDIKMETNAKIDYINNMLALSKNKICPVWNMIHPDINVKINVIVNC